MANDNKLLRSESIYQVIRERILNGDYSPGERLLVLDIAKEFEVSQSPVREALERLKQEGLTVSVKNKGSVVSKINLQEVKDSYQLREILEEYALRYYLKHKPKSNLEQLERIYTDMQAAATNNDMLELIDLDMQFHQFFFEQCNNGQLLKVWENIKFIMTRFVVTTNKRFFPDLESVVRTHQALINSLRHYEPSQEDAVVELFISHIKEVWQKIEQVK
ncbi:GntR family transcriptional regulator [Paenibacillus yanchengensis]|uniref:GntR family transcriptional regulator n=1 Tax=Paenibacillus yanchengensis TaxID=2035833 RepID=A0ABW4YP28_9BACL